MRQTFKVPPGYRPNHDEPRFAIRYNRAHPLTGNKLVGPDTNFAQAFLILAMVDGFDQRHMVDALIQTAGPAADGFDVEPD